MTGYFPAWLFKGGNFWYILLYQYHHQSQELNPTFSLFTSSMIHTHQFTKLTFCQSRRQRYAKKFSQNYVTIKTSSKTDILPLSPSLSLVDPVFGVEVLILLADEVLGGVPSATGPALD